MTKAAPTTNRRRLLLPEMEGMTARWYDRQRGTPSQIANWRLEAARLTARLAPGAAVLEVAPGPGYLALEIARVGGLQVHGLDISRTMVEIARGHAGEAGLDIDFQLGDAAAMPFADGSFDLAVCQAAFKNFRRPPEALNEMHRVLRGGGAAIIQDLRREASRADISAEVRAQQLGGVNSVITRWILAGLRNRAYTSARLEELATASAFGTGTLRADGIGLELRLEKA